MRLSRKFGLNWHICLFDISGKVGYSFGVLQIVLGWCMSGVGLVEGRPILVPAKIYGVYVDTTHIQLVNVISTRSVAPDGPPPGM